MLIERTIEGESDFLENARAVYSVHDGVFSRGIWNARFFLTSEICRQECENNDNGNRFQNFTMLHTCRRRI